MYSRSLIMADSLPDLQFSLPTEFLTDDDPLLHFPVDFPYEFGLVDSTASSDEDEFVVGLTQPRPSPRPLTQQLPVDPKKKMCSSGSPKSTLCGIGSWSMSSNSTNGEVSPPTTPPGTRCDKSEPIYAGGGGGHVYSNQRFVYSVSQLQNQNHPFNQSYSVWGRQQLKSVSSHQLLQNQIQTRGAITTAAYQGGGRFVRPLGLPQSAWPPLQVQQNKYRSPANSSTGVVVLSGSGVKRSCAGTGVFLPRRFDDSAHIKKSDCSTELLPAKLESNNYQSINGAFASKQGNQNSLFADHASMATKNGLLAQNKVNLPTIVPTESAVKYELCLPQEWIY